MKLALVYLLLAVLATLCNLAAQDLITHLYGGPGDLWLSMAMGTGVGLVVKYLLDKRYIFGFRADNLTHEGHVFFLYTAVGVGTTLLFWCVEFAFDYLFHTRSARYTGAALGLALGYLVKYRLDKRFVFRQVPA
jgi:putative flippase GtrA